MARLEIPKNLKEMYGSFHQMVKDAAQKIDAPMEYPLESVAGPGLIETIFNMAVPENVSEAFTGEIMGLSPGYIAANYRTPEMIAALRRAMAEENRARGELKTLNTSFGKTVQTGSELDRMPNGSIYPSPIYGSEINFTKSPDPVDQILRGSWFHGDRPEARAEVLKQFGKDQFGFFPQYKMSEILPGVSTDFVKRGYPLTEDLALPAINQFGLPASTHATPSYTRFGEPYGVSITASPSIARNFAADEYIHRVQPLYGGPPTQRIIPMWRPEGVKAMNEGYNQAFNELLNMPLKPIHPRIPSDTLNEIIANQVNNIGTFDNRAVHEMSKNFLENNPHLTGPFNTLYSKALQDQGYRGILYSPQRYGEYEMLMLDPKYVRPLDYRKVGDYTGYRETLDGPKSTVGRATPGAWKGYIAAEPEFATGVTRLSDVFNQMPWVDRINEENKRRIAELVDAQYREQVINQLFGGR